jgi:hypothetical protein
VAESGGRAVRSSNGPDKGWLREFLSRREYGYAFDSNKWTDSTPPPIDENNALWKQYAIFVDLYKYYLEVAWKVSVWYYATTGAILVYFFDHVGNGVKPLPYVLLFLAFISLGFSLVLGRASKNLFSMMKAMDWIATKLQLPGRPHIEFAGLFLLGTSAMILLVGVASVVLFIAAPWVD